MELESGEEPQVESYTDNNEIQDCNTLGDESQSSSLPGWESVIDDDSEFIETVANMEKADADRSDTLKTDSTSEDDDRSSIKASTIFEKAASRMARHPWKFFLVAWLLAIVLGVVGLFVGNFTISVDNAGWTSRGTLIANRQTQTGLVWNNKERLFQKDNEEAWEDILNNVQPGWETGGDDGGRRLQTDDAATTSAELDAPYFASKNGSRMLASSPRNLQTESFSPGLEQCAVNWYRNKMLTREHLWPVWETKGDVSALDPRVIRDMCVAEENTNRVLAENELCTDGCRISGSCLRPYSLVLFARMQVGDLDFTMSCDDLSAQWADRWETVESDLLICVADIKKSFSFNDDMPESCPLGFSPVLVDEMFGETNDDGSINRIVRYTSSIFATVRDVEGLYEIADDYDRAGNSDVVSGAYDTQWEAFVNFTVDVALNQDMLVAVGSAAVTAFAILVHTRSPWLTLTGLFQIVLSFPLAYFIYNLVAGLKFFPFLNFIGVYVVFALGADDIFVAADKWKNARLDYKHATTEQIAIIALPDAASAMFLTTITTAVAFFGTAICPVAPLKMFAIFVGLLVMFDYFLCVFLFFPALCLYDMWLQRGSRNPCVACHLCHQFEDQGQDSMEGDNEQEETKPSLIRRILLKFYDGIHAARWGLLIISIGAAILCGFYAAQLGLPTSADVRLLTSSNEYELSYQWRLNLLSQVLVKEGGSPGFIVWGVRPADTGNYNDPTEWSQLVLDDSFDPSSEAAQVSVKNFCPQLFAEQFAENVDVYYECPMNRFDNWLQEQSRSFLPVEEYSWNCGGATKVPVPQENFHDCIIAWSRLATETSILQRDGEVKIISLYYQTRVRYDSSFDELNSEWHAIESWMDGQIEKAPPGVAKMFSSSGDFWWYDTNGQLLRTAYGSASIALAAAAIVMLVSSRSFSMMFFALFTIGFILLSVTAMLVASGWSLGFLESICFAILIGISCDFVIHFGHAYTTQPGGDHNRHERSKYALIRMGPSILAAAFTTICAAFVMFFTVIVFFQKFALILFYTVVMATLGALVVFITLTDTLGPSQPTVLVDAIVEWFRTLCCACRKTRVHVERPTRHDGTIKFEI